MKGTYVNTKSNLFVPGKKKGLQQPGGALSPHPLGLSQCLSPPPTHTHACMHARTRMPHPKMAVALARQLCWLEGVLWNLFWSRGCIQEDSKPCEIVLLPEGGT